MVLAVDPLGGVFLAVSGAVAAAAAVYGIGYSRHGLDGRAVQAALPLFVVALLLVPAAGSVATFLLCWELMALTSLVLVVAEHRHRAAGRLRGPLVRGDDPPRVRRDPDRVAAAGRPARRLLRRDPGRAHLSPRSAGLVFVLCLIGFGSKAGIVPLHAWLPRAHPEAPSHVSALMSAAMVNLGVYGIVRVGFDLLGGGTTLVVAARAGARRGLGACTGSCRRWSAPT